MCIAIVKPAGKWVTKEHLYNSFNANRDGAGYAYIDAAGETVIRKGYFSFEAFYKAYSAEVSSEHNALIHFRISTAGTKNEANCHPFSIANGALMHNGPSLNWSSCKGDKERSDTRQFAEDFVQTLSFEQVKAIQPMIEHYIGSEKIAFLFNNNEFVICNEKNGLWFEGCWYSNSGFRGYFSQAGRAIRDDSLLYGGYAGYGGGYKGSSYATGSQGGTKGSTKNSAVPAPPVMRSIGARPGLFRCKWSPAIMSFVPTDIIVDKEHLTWDEQFQAFIPQPSGRPLSFDKKYVYEATPEAAKKTPLDYTSNTDWVIIGDILNNEGEVRAFLHDALPWAPPAPPAAAPAPAPAAAAAAPATKATTTLPATVPAADASVANTAAVVH